MKKLLQTALSLLVVCLSVPSLKAQVTIGESHVNVTCHSGNNGSINLTPSGGTSPYTYAWNGGAATQNRTSLTAGTYSVTVTDFLGASASASINITQPTAMSTSSTTTQVTCGGGNDGGIDFTVTGGTPGYSFLWHDGSTDEDRVNMYAANYYITVTDGAGCQKIDSANVTQPMGMVPTMVATDANCNANNGHINLTVQYGYPPYTYLWNDGATSEDRVSLMIGNYTVTVTDSINCSVWVTAIINQDNSPMNINRTFTNVSCFGGNNGTITVTSVTGGGGGPFTYNWSNGGNTAVNSGLTIGTYTVTVTSPSGCVETASATISQPPLLELNRNVFPITCNGNNNGAITTIPSGGTSPYTYGWNDGPFTQNRMGLAPGTYTATVTDSRGCTATTSGTITEPLQLNVTTTPSPLACSGGATGSVTTTVTGGVSPYTYWWGGGITTQHRINVGAGTYNVTVTDANGCNASGSGTIAGYTPLGTGTASVTNVSCYAGNNGAINLSVSNGLAPYTYVWSNGDTIQDITGMSAGSYTVTVTDNRACTATRTVSVTQPSFPVSISSSITDVSCNAAANGAITLTINNGTSPFTFIWSDAGSGQNRTGLAGGSYQVTVTTANSCSVQGSYSVAEPAAIVAVATPTHTTCFGGNNGSVQLSVTGGFAPYAYAWSNGPSTQNINTLTAATYSVTIQDSHNCSVSTSAEVGQAPNVTIATSITNVSCFGLGNGIINLTLSGSSAPYSFAWNDGPATEDRTNLGPGSYSVIVTDNNACNYTASGTITEPAAIVVTETHNNEGCSGAGTGSINLTVTGGVSPYTYLWSNGANSQNLSNINAGTYTATITDASMCTATRTVVIAQTPAISITEAHTNVLCAGGNSGTISITTNTGTAPYTFSWNDGNNQQNRTGLLAGTYQVTVTDANSCSTTTSATLTEPVALSLTYTKQDVTCFGAATGSIDFTVTGGTGAYSYAWNSGQNTQDITNIAAGNYLPTVTDANGCSVSAAVIINQPAQLIATASSTPVLCNGGSTGTVTASATGGAGNYQYTWATATGSTYSNRPVGSYTVTVTDANTCSTTATASVAQPAPIGIAAMVNDASCSNASNGSINSFASGGVGNYQYTWNTNATTSAISGLAGGSYTVTVRDGNSCLASHTFIITEPTAIQLTTTTTNAGCSGSSTGSIDLTVSGGAASYQYIWSNAANTQDVSNIIAGNYSVTVTDGNTCQATASVNVNQSAAIDLTLSITHATCFNTANGTITSNVTGGAPASITGYLYTWSNGSSAKNLSALAAGTYSVTVYDGTNCSATATTVVQQPSSIAITETHTNVNCNGGNNGAINISVSGGTGNYTYLWNNNLVTQDLNNLTAGSYTVTVKDSSACAAQQTVTIAQPAALTVTEAHTDYACVSSQGSINISVNGGTSPYTFNWADGSNAQNRVQLGAGTYSVIVSDNQNCTAAQSVSVAALPVLNSSFSKIDIACYAAGTGAIDLTVSGGKAPYNYVWNTGAQTQDIQNLAAGVYDVVIQDGNNCVIVNSATITQPTPLQASAVAGGAICYGQNTGSVDVTVSGGIAPYTYLWSNNKTTQDIFATAAGNYNVTVTDAAGCTTAVSSISITQPAQIALNAATTTESCQGNDGTVQLNVTGGTSPYAYQWNTGSTANGITALAAGTYTTTVSDNNGCSATGSSIVGKDVPMALEAITQNTACAEVSTGSIALTVSGGTPGYTFNWSNGATSQDVQQLPQGSYTVTVTDAKQCSVEGSYTLTYNYTLSVYAGEDKMVIAGQYVPLTATANENHGNNYTWSGIDGLSCNECSSTTLHAAQSGIAMVTVVDANGCTATDSVAVDVTEITGLYIPNAFTPNGDGNNDVFEVYGDNGSIYYFEMKIFNRWGEKVFESNDTRSTWDGTYRGESVENGVFVYIAKAVFLDGSSREYKGSVTSIR
jgi:gliding motility-associated-like protein